MLIQRYLCLIFIFILQFFFLSCSNALTDEEKTRIFYKNDWMFFFGDKEGIKPELLAEESKTDELFSIDQIRPEYRGAVKEYLAVFQDFINKNFSIIKDYHDYIVKKASTKDYFIKIDKELTDRMKNELLPKLKNGVRCMLAVGDTQYIEVAKRVDKDRFALTITSNAVDGVYWARYFRYQEYGGTPNILDSQGAIKYPEWFYESNLKIRIVKQIRDEKGNYLGELYADYYKLDQYDKLFDGKGNPRKLKK
jgi:hypothetical protein